MCSCLYTNAGAHSLHFLSQHTVSSTLTHKHIVSPTPRGHGLSWVGAVIYLSDETEPVSGWSQGEVQTPWENCVFPRFKEVTLKQRANTRCYKIKLSLNGTRKQKKKTSHTLSHFSKHVFKLGCKSVYLIGLYGNPIFNEEEVCNRASDKNK